MLETIITILLQAIAFGLVYYFASWLATRKFQSEIERLDKSIWQLRAILAGKGYGILEHDGEDTISHSFVTTNSNTPFCTKYYSNDNTEQPCLNDTKDENSCD